MGNDLSIYSSANDDFAGVRQQDVIMPRLMLQQSNSPGVQDGKYKMGDIVDSQQESAAIGIGSTGSIVPLMFWLEWIEWNPDRAAPRIRRFWLVRLILLVSLPAWLLATLKSILRRASGFASRSITTSSL